MHQSVRRRRGVRPLLPLLALLTVVPALEAQEPVDTVRPAPVQLDSIPSPDTTFEAPPPDSAAAAAVEGDTVDVVRRRHRNQGELLPGHTRAPYASMAHQPEPGSTYR